jgi:signal transduction histidine kinase
VTIVRSRLVRDAAAVIGGGVIVAVLALLLALLPEKRESLEAVLEAEAAGTAKLFASLTPPTPDFTDMAAALIEPFLQETRILGVTTGDGKGTRWLSLGLSPPEISPRFDDIPARGAFLAYGPGRKYIDFAWTLHFNNDPERPYVLAARMDAKYVEEELTEFAVAAVAIGVLAAAMLTVAMVGFINLSIIRPVLRLRTRMHAAALDPDHPERYRDPANEAGEIGDMARSFNGMISRIGENLAARQQAEDAAHAARDAAEKALADLRTAQQSLIEAEKMAALGGLVAGVAHEINTPVGNALGAISHLHRKSRQVAELFQAGKLRKQDADEFISVTLEAGDIAMNNIQRASALVQSFKQVAADHTADQRRRFRLDDYLNEVLTSLTPQVRRNKLAVETDMPVDIEMESYPGALAQVLTNLVCNAGLHAYGDDWTGPRPLRIAARMQDDGQVRLEVSDRGRGMPPEVLARVFEPFFTTKRGAGGTGLGMHIVFNLATQKLGGRIEAAGRIKSDAAGAGEEDHGTVFTVTLPLTAPAAAAQPDKAEGAKP